MTKLQIPISFKVLNGAYYVHWNTGYGGWNIFEVDIVLWEIDMWMFDTLILLNKIHRVRRVSYHTIIGSDKTPFHALNLITIIGLWKKSAHMITSKQHKKYKTHPFCGAHFSVNFYIFENNNPVAPIIVSRI